MTDASRALLLVRQDGGFEAQSRSPAHGLAKTRRSTCS